MATTQQPLLNSSDLMKSLSRNLGKDGGGALPFNFLGSLRSSQENHPRQPDNLPDLSKLNLGRLKSKGTAGTKCSPSKPHRSVLSEANVNHVMVLNHHPTSRHTIDLLSCLKNSSKNVIGGQIRQLDSNRVPKSAIKSISSIIQTSPKPITIVPRKNASTSALGSPPKEPVPMEVDVEEIELPTSKVELSGFGKVFASQWRTTQPTDLSSQPKNLMDFLAQPYAEFDPTVPTAFEIVHMEEERRLKKDWKKEVERSTKASKEQPPVAVTPQVPPYILAGSHRFQFQAN